MNQGKRVTPFNYINRAALCALCVLAGYAVFFATANYTRDLGFSVWGIALCFFGVSALLCIFRDFRSFIKEAIKDVFLGVLIIYGLWIIFSIFRGTHGGYAANQIILDIKRIYIFALYPLIVWVLQSGKRIRVLMKCIVYASLALGIISCVYTFAYIMNPAFFDKLLYVGYYGECINFTKISPTVCRILFVSSPFQIAGCAFSLYFSVAEKKTNWIYASSIGINLFAVFVTYARSLYQATVVAAAIIIFLYAICYPQKRKQVAASTLCAAVVFAFLVACLSACSKINVLGFALQRTLIGFTVIEETHPTEGIEPSTAVTLPPATGSSPAPSETAPLEIPDYNSESEYLEATQISDRIRQEIKANLLLDFRRSPLLGLGLGYMPPSRNTPSEFFFLELAVKTGIIGIALFLLPFVLMGLHLVGDVRKKCGSAVTIAWFTLLAGLMTYAIFQPYMNNAPCVLIYSCALAVSHNEHNMQ